MTYYRQVRLCSGLLSSWLCERPLLTELYEPLDNHECAVAENIYHLPEQMADRTI